MKALFQFILALFLLGVLINIIEKYGVFLIIGVICLILLYFWAKKKGYIKSSDAKQNTTQKNIESNTISKESARANEIHPSFLADNYRLAYHYDSVKFYPPIEMVSKINKKLLRSGAEVFLKPEPENKYDNQAIALYVPKHQIGYLLRGTLQDMVHDYIAKEWPIKATLLSLKLINGEYQGYIALSFYRKVDEIPQNIKRPGYHDIDIHAIHPTNPNAHPNTPLTDKDIVFSGCFTIPIDEMMQIAVDAGATLKSRVTKNTKYLVVGTQGQSCVNENGMSSKEATATKLIQQGDADIKIIDEKTFINLSKEM